jgi:hypothetical protein
MPAAHPAHRAFVVVALLAAASAVARAGQVVITEIMYNPASSEAAPNDTEWIEIYNTGESAVNLTGWFLQDEDGRTGAIGSFILGPKEATVLIPADQQDVDFRVAWGIGKECRLVRLTGWNDGGLNGLDNEPSATNEILTLRNGLGGLEDEVNFDDDGTWPSDFPEGPSIYLLSSALSDWANDLGANWARSEDGVDGAHLVSMGDEFDGEDVGSPCFVAIPEPASASVAVLLLLAARRRS